MIFRIVITESDTKTNLVLYENINKRLKSFFEIPLRRRQLAPDDITGKHNKRRLIFCERLTQKKVCLFRQFSFTAFQMNICQLKKPKLTFRIESYFFCIVMTTSTIFRYRKFLFCRSATGYSRESHGSGKKVSAVYLIFIHRENILIV